MNMHTDRTTNGYFSQSMQQITNSAIPDDSLPPLPQFLASAPTAGPNHLFAGPAAGYNHRDGQFYPPQLGPIPIHDHSMVHITPPLAQSIQVSMEHYLRQWQERTIGTQEAILQKIAEMEAKLADIEKRQAGSQEVSTEGVNKPPKKIQSMIVEVIQQQAKTLLGVSEVREIDNTTGKTLPKKLILPIPHTAEGYDPRTSNGSELFSPDWTAGKNNAYNRRYLNAIIESTLRQAADKTILVDVPKEYCTFEIFQHAAEQFFSTLVQNYMAQINPLIAEKQSRKLGSNKLLGRKRTKHARRLSAWPAFKKKHNIEDDLAYLINMGYMSEEDEGPGKVSVEVWQTEARKVSSAGQIVFETLRLPWRAEKLIRFYYALDNESFNPSDSAIKRAKLSHVRFHGIKENETLATPQRLSGSKLVPVYLIDQNWHRARKNLHLSFDKSPEPQGWATLVIDDKELDPRDLDALQMWQAEQESALEEAGSI